MTIRAYNELYLNDAQLLLANAFDYALNDCEQSPDLFAKIFAFSKQSKEIENGNPAFVSGKGAEELVKEILSSIYPDEKFSKAVFKQEKSAAYWVGWVLAYYQWYTVKKFKDIFEKIPLTEILSMYSVYHEMDVTSFVEDLEKRYNSKIGETKLKKIREAKKLSQNDLAKISGVKKRSIQLYEQRVNDINKAQAHTVYKLAKVLGCEIEDILENPEKTE